MPEEVAISHPSPYLVLKFASAMFKAVPAALDAMQMQQVLAAAARAEELERRILSSREAAGVVVGEEALQRGLAEIRTRFASEEDFAEELARHSMDQPRLCEEIARNLRVDTVLERISTKVASISNAEVEIFYLIHHERFQLPERRTMRHILITVNEDIPENTAAQAYAKLADILGQCQSHPERFAELALRHSECPTAMQGGLLGQVQRNQLYPALDTAAFAMRPGELSAILESPLGLHILRCDNISPAGCVPLNQVRERIREQLLSVRRQNKQRAWIKSLPARKHTVAEAA
ncbi:nitrogen fixation protein NifM [Uliginosibacterium gangwonense]|uniref:nitrogen fixation protein NifM n=1 Tax=Uliginosibacterium gangwonense TaxID=392736 RepID=UPI00036D98FE|nr:nitrogen fixation protein NifM [Uliginosibacterium gangwonense]